MIAVENISGPVAYHGEGPVWSDSWGGVRWMDATRGDVLTLKPGGIKRLHIDDSYLAFMRPQQGGGYVAAGAKHLYMSEHPDTVPDRSFPLIGHERARINEGGTDRQGRLFAGSADLPGNEAQGVLLRIDTGDGNPAVSLALSGVSASNGIDFSPDGTRAYYVDSLTRQIDVFDYQEGLLVNRRNFARFEVEDGLPDGLTVAQDGSVWVGMWGGYCVRGFDSMGTPISVITLPVPQVTACTFGGPDLSLLYITTSALGLNTGNGDSDGSLFVCSPGVNGIPVTPFANQQSSGSREAERSQPLGSSLGAWFT